MSKEVSFVRPRVRNYEYERQQGIVTPSFNKDNQGCWFMPILYKSAGYSHLCEAVSLIYAKVDFSNVPKLNFTYAKNLLKYSLKSCDDSVLVIHLVVSTIGLGNYLKKKNPRLKTQEDDWAHANVLLVHRDKTTRKLVVEHFEPHGSMLDLEYLFDLYPIILKDLEAILTEAAGEPIDYLAPSSVCPVPDGPQSRTESNETSVGSAGYCATWTLAWVDLRLNNMDVPADVLMKSLLSLPNDELFDFVLNYAYYAEKLWKASRTDGKEYVRVGRQVMDDLDMLVPKLINVAGKDSEGIIINILKAIHSAPDTKSLKNLLGILEIIVKGYHQPNDWSDVSYLFRMIRGFELDVKYTSFVQRLTSIIIRNNSFGQKETYSVLKIIEQFQKYNFGKR